jgi:ectoine hydroxylase-related dioxygenase (phytanoyl-CoA dioxygenase family)
MAYGQYSSDATAALAQQVIDDGHCILPGLIPDAKLRHWNEVFRPLLDAHIAREGHLQNRGSERYYVTLPFVEPFADPEIFADPDLLAIVARLVGEDMVMVQLATDTPMRGSDFQDVHRDTRPLFPEWGIETPPYQLAVNFPLVDVTEENGPFEVARGTHMVSKEEGLRLIASGERPLEPIMLKRGDVMIRDVRHLHRGTPNRTDEPRPMVVIGYSRRWLYRPEVSITIPRATWERLGERERGLLRFNTVVESLDDASGGERYQAFAY